MISPLLFDIYVESLIEKIHKNHNIPISDILFYADDLAIICSYNAAERVIETVENEAKNLSLIINKKKSGILPIKNSRFKFTLLTKPVREIPIV